MSQEKNNDKSADIPDFKNLEEKIEFWESHSPLDYPELWEEVEIDFDQDLRNCHSEHAFPY